MWEDIVAKLPRTKDGVPVVPGKDVVYKWSRYRQKIVAYEIETCEPEDCMYSYVLLDEIQDCYSRPELVPGP